MVKDGIKQTNSKIQPQVRSKYGSEESTCCHVNSSNKVVDSENTLKMPQISPYYVLCTHYYFVVRQDNWQCVVCSTDKTRQTLSNMRSILFLVVTFTGMLARPEHGHRRSDIQEIKRRYNDLPQVLEGDCPPLWTDASSVGLGCILVDINDMGTDETHAEELCNSFEAQLLI